MSTHNIGLGKEIMDLEYHHSLLSGATITTLSEALVIKTNLRYSLVHAVRAGQWFTALRIKTGLFGDTKHRWNSSGDGGTFNTGTSLSKYNSVVN